MAFTASSSKSILINQVVNHPINHLQVNRLTTDKHCMANQIKFNFAVQKRTRFVVLNGGGTD